MLTCWLGPFTSVTDPGTAFCYILLFLFMEAYVSWPRIFVRRVFRNSEKKKKKNLETKWLKWVCFEPAMCLCVWLLFHVPTCLCVTFMCLSKGCTVVASWKSATYNVCSLAVQLCTNTHSYESKMNVFFSRRNRGKYRNCFVATRAQGTVQRVSYTVWNAS